MRKQDIVIGIIAILAIIFIVYRIRNSSEPNIVSTPTPPSSEEKLEDLLNRQLPDSGEKIELRDVLGISASAIATREVEDKTTKITVLADLPNLETGQSYQAWAQKGEKGNSDYELVTLGLLTQAKGGWLGEFEADRDLGEFNHIVISREQVVDSVLETIISSGTFTQ